VREPGLGCLIPGSTSGTSSSSRSELGWTHRPRARLSHEPPRRARRVRGRSRATAAEGVLGRLRPVPLLRPHAGRDLPLQQARPAVRSASRRIRSSS
jgi:hypothetical protein